MYCTDKYFCSSPLAGLGVPSPTRARAARCAHLLSIRTSRKIGIFDHELRMDGIEDDADPMMVVCDLLGKVESKAVHLSQYAHLLRDENDEGKRNLEAAEEEQQEIEDKEPGPGDKEVAPLYMKPRAPSVRDDDDGDYDAPLSVEYLRQQLQGKGEEMLRIALAPGDDAKDGARGDFAHRPRRTNTKGSGVAASMKKLSPHSAVPALSTAKLSSAGDGKGQVASGAVSSREGGRTSRNARQVVPAGSKTSR